MVTLWHQRPGKPGLMSITVMMTLAVIVRWRSDQVVRQAPASPWCPTQGLENSGRLLFRWKRCFSSDILVETFKGVDFERENTCYKIYLAFACVGAEGAKSWFGGRRRRREDLWNPARWLPHRISGGIPEKKTCTIWKEEVVTLDYRGSQAFYDITFDIWR